MSFITDQSLAAKAVGEAVSSGRIPPARALPCADCSGPAIEYHHHEGYGADSRLVVVALCRGCHHKRPHPSKHLRYHDNGKVDAISVRPRRRGLGVLQAMA